MSTPNRTLSQPEGSLMVPLQQQRTASAEILSAANPGSPSSPFQGRPLSFNMSDLLSPGPTSKGNSLAVQMQGLALQGGSDRSLTNGPEGSPEGSPHCQDEVKSDTEEIEEEFEMNGKRYRRKIRRRRIVRKAVRTSQETVTMATNSSVGGGSNGSVEDSVRYQAMMNAAKENSPNSMALEPVANYMFQFGVSDTLHEPIVSNEFFDELENYVRSQWYAWEEDIEGGHSKTVAYVEQSAKRTADGARYTRSTCVQQTQTIRITPGANISTNLANLGFSELAIEGGRDSKSTEVGENGSSEGSRVEITKGKLPADGTRTGLEDNGKDIRQELPPITGSESEDFPGPCWSPILGKVDATEYLIIEEQTDTENDHEVSVKAGNVDALIVYATSIGKRPRDYYLFFETYLVTYRVFLSSEQLVAKLVARYIFFRTQCPSDLTEAQRDRLCNTVVSFLINVVSQLGRDLSETLHKRLTRFHDRLLEDKETKLAELLLTTMETQKASLATVDCMDASENRQLAITNNRTSLKSQCLLDMNPKTVAEQMTLLEAQKFDKLQLEDLLDVKAIEKEKIPSLVQCVNHFNTVTRWARTLILVDTRKSVAERERYIWKICGIMENLHEMRNFSSYLALLCALIHIPDSVWTKKTKAKLDKVRAYMTPPSFMEYRRDLAEACLPCLPYLGLIFQHLLHLAAGNSLFIDPPSDRPEIGKMVNFWRCAKHFLIINIFVKKHTTARDNASYKIKRNEDVLLFLNDFRDNLPGNDLDTLSSKLSQSMKK